MQPSPAEALHAISDPLLLHEVTVFIFEQLVKLGAITSRQKEGRTAKDTLASLVLQSALPACVAVAIGAMEGTSNESN